MPCWDCDRARQAWPAFGEWTLGMWTAWAFNRFLREGDVGDISLNQWLTSWRGRWDWDPNGFVVNQIGHPLQGATYFNGYRTNGYSFWTASAMTLVGSFVWECCGEKNLPAVNDLLTTWIGGTGVGEITRRLSDAVLDNEARGAERFWREAGAFAVNPVRGFDRIVRGHAHRVGANPPDARPHNYRASVVTGALALGTNRTGETQWLTGAKLAGRVVYGDPSQLTEAPFSTFEVDFELTSIPGAPLYFMRSEGNLWGKVLRRQATGTDWLLSSHLRYDYVRSRAFEIGAQSVTFGVERDYMLFKKVRVTAGTRLRAIPIAAVEDDFQPPSDEGRNYDYTYGGGLELQTSFTFPNDFRVRTRSSQTALRVIDGVATSHVLERQEFLLDAPLGHRTRFEAGLRYQTRRSYFADQPRTRAYAPEFWLGLAINPPRWRR